MSVAEEESKSDSAVGISLFIGLGVGVPAWLASASFKFGDPVSCGVVVTFFASAASIGPIYDRLSRKG